MPRVVVELPRVPEPPDEADVLREQLDYLLGGARFHGKCDCPDCERYRRVRHALLEPLTSVKYTHPLQTPLEMTEPRRRKRRALD